MKQIFDCRFLYTAQFSLDEDITPSELDSQLAEFTLQAKALLCGQPYLEVSDTYDSLVMAFDKVLSRKKRTDRGCSQRGPAQAGSLQPTQRVAA